MSRKHSHYSASDKLAIASQYGLVPMSRIARQLRRPTAAVLRQAYRLGLVNAYGDTERMEEVRAAVIRRLQGEQIAIPPKPVKPSKPKRLKDSGRSVRVLPPTGAGCGPRIIHRIAA